MKHLTLLIPLVLVIAGCSSWGDYYYKSEHLNFNVTFPEKWEVFDRSDGINDYLEARIPADDPDALITVKAQAMAPDIRPSHLYPMFMEGSGDGTILTEFEIYSKGMIPSKKSESRYIIFTYLTDEHRVKGMRVLLLGFRVKVIIEMETSEDNFHKHEREFREMIKHTEVKQL